jgi:hypothetical protein
LGQLPGLGKKKEAIRRDEIALHEYQGGEK